MGVSLKPLRHQLDGPVRGTKVLSRRPVVAALNVQLEELRKKCPGGDLSLLSTTFEGTSDFYPQLFVPLPDLPASTVSVGVNTLSDGQQNRPSAQYHTLDSGVYLRREHSLLTVKVAAIVVPREVVPRERNDRLIAVLAYGGAVLPSDTYANLWVHSLGGFPRHLLMQDPQCTRALRAKWVVRKMENYVGPGAFEPFGRPRWCADQEVLESDAA